MDEKAKAMRMLEMLRVRTESRGATPAEAEQAAIMVDRICNRYGIDPKEVSSSEAYFKMPTNKFPSRSYSIARCVISRMGIEHSILQRTGHSSWVKFSGPEHLVSVACWLFHAIVNDIANRSQDACQNTGLNRVDNRAFREKFRMSAAFAVQDRLAPEVRVEINISAEDLQKERDFMERCDQREKARLKKMTRSERREHKKKQQLERRALLLGVKCGMQVEIGTNAVGDRSGVTQAIEH